MNIAIATCSSIPNLLGSDQEIMQLLKAKGIDAEAKIWDDECIEWSEYDVVLIRTVWGYHLKYEHFISWLKKLEDIGVKVLNSINILKENVHKFYLQRMEAAGIEIIPSFFINRGTDLEFTNIQNLGWEKAVIKPAVSASSHNTELFDPMNAESVRGEFAQLVKTSDFLIQKFIPEIQSFGELSIIFFNREYSHTVLKTAEENEFRVQSEFGGMTERYYPSSSVIESAQKVLNQFEGNLLYARIDGVLIEDKFVLMEAEMVEPDLFFKYKPDSNKVFVSAMMDLL